MSSRNQNVINVAIMDDSEQWAKQFINTIQKVAGQAEVSVSLDKAQMKEDVSAIESDINKLKKDLKAVKTGKIDSKGFDEFKKIITKDVDVLKEKTANLESVVQSLVKTMADSDAGALSKMLQDVQGNMEQLQKTAMNTVDAVGAIRQAGKDFGQDVNLVNPNEATLLERERKTLVQMFQTFKRMDSVLDGHSSVAQLVKGLQEAADKFKFNAKMYSQEGLEQELEAHYQKFVELQKKLSDASENEATAIQKELLTVGATFSDLYNKAINSKEFNFKKDNVFRDYIDSINEGLDEAYNQAATRYEKIAGKLKTLGVDKPVEDMQGGIEIKTTPDELKQKAADIIKLAQDFLDSRPLYATVDLNTKWGNRKNQKAIKDFQAKIDTLSAGGNIEEVEKLKQLYEDVRQSFNKDIDINIKTHFKEGEDKIDSAVSNIQNKLKEKNFDIKTHVTFGPEAEAQLQTDLQKLADATTLTLTNVKIGDKAGKKAIDKATLNGALTNLIDNTARISGGTDDVYDNLVKIREVLESLPSVTDNVVNSLHELARLMSTAFHITGGDELNTTFDGLQKRVANIVKSIDGNIKGQIKEDLGQIVKEFNSEYKNLGGEKELFDLSDNEKIRGWFKRNASKFKDEAKEVNSSSTQIGENLTESYAKGIEQATPVVIDAVDKLSETAVDTAKDNLQNWNTVGKQSVGSFANGIEEQIPKVESAVDKMVSAALAALSSGLDHSSGDMGKILSDKMTQTLPQELGESLKASAQTIDFNKANEGINDVNSSLNGLDLILKKIVENVDDVSQLSDALSKLQNYQATDKTKEYGFNVLKNGTSPFVSGEKTTVSIPEIVGTLLQGHSHPSGIAAMSLPRLDGKNLRGGDLVSAYYNFMRGVKAQVIAGAENMLVFDAEGYFKAMEAENVNFTNTAVKKEIAKEAKNRDILVGKELDNYLKQNLENVITRYKSNLSDYIKNIDGLSAEAIEKHLNIINSTDIKDIFSQYNFQSNPRAGKDLVIEVLERFNKQFRQYGLGEIADKQFTGSSLGVLFPKLDFERIATDVNGQIINKALKNLGYSHLPDISNFTSNIPYTTLLPALEELEKFLKATSNTTKVSVFKQYVQDLHSLQKELTETTNKAETLNKTISEKPKAQTSVSTESIDEINSKLEDRTKKLKSELDVYKAYENPKTQTDKFLRDESHENIKRLTSEIEALVKQKNQLLGITGEETQAYQKQSEAIAQISAARKRLSQNKIDSINATLDNFKVPGSNKKKIASEARSRLKVQADNLNKLGDNAPWEEQYTSSIKFLKLFETYRDNMAGKTSAALKQYQGMYDALKPRQSAMEADLRELISGVNLETPKQQAKYIEANLTEMGNAGKKATETLSQGEEDAYQKAVKLSERLSEIKTQMIALANTEDGSLHSQIGKDVLYYTPNHKGEATEGELQLKSLIKEYNQKTLAIRDLGYVDINGELLKKNLQSNDLLDEKLMNQLKSRASKEQSAAKIAKYLNHYKLTSDERFLDDILGTLDSEGISGNLGNKIYKIVEDELNRISAKSSTSSPIPEIAKETTEQLSKVEEKAKETAQQVEKAISTTVESPLSNVDRQIAEVEKKLEAEKKLAQVYANPTNQAEKDLQADALYNVNRLTEELKKLQAQKESVAKTPTPEIIDTKKTEQEISVVEKNFEKLQAIAKNYGNWNLNKKGAKHDLSTMIDQFIKYKRDGGTKSLSDLTNNEKALEKLQKEYDRQMSAIQQKAKETANVTKQELKTVTKQTKVEKDIAKEEPKTSSPLTDKAQKIVDGMQKASSETKEVVKNIQEIGNATSQASTQVQSLDSKFESIKQATKGFGSFNLSLTADKDGIQSIISNFIDYKKQGGTKELSDLTNNKNALKKLQKEYRNQMGAIKTEVTQTMTAVKEQTNQLAQSTEKAQASIKKPISSGNTQKATQEIKEQTAEIKEQTVEIEKNKQAKKENISTPAVDTKATEGASSIKEETSAFTQMPESAEKAASAKKEFAEANKAVLESIVNSLRGLDAESRGFGNLYKLINSIGGTKGDEKIDRVVEGLLKLRDTFNMPMETNNTLLTQLNELASAGENLKDLAEVLKATRTQVKNALKQVADNKDSILNDPDSSKLVSMYATEYLEKSGSFKVVDTQVKELEHGLVQVIALTKDANDQFQEFNLKTKDGFNFETVGMDENTARIAKQLKVFRQVQSAFERMNAKAQNTTDTMFVNGNDKASFNIVNQYLDEFGVHLGDIQKIVRSVRKEGEDFLESFHVIGTLGDIDFGRDGILFDNQNIYDADKVVKMYKELTSDTKNYFELKEKIVSDDYSEDDIEHFQRLQNKIHETNDAAKNLIAILGDNPLITEARNKFAVTTSDNYQKSLQQFIKTQTNQFKNKDIVNANQRIDFAPEIQKQVDEAKKALSELQGILNKGLDADKFSDEALKNIHKLVDTVRKASLSVKEASGKEVSQRMVDKLASQVSNTIHENTAMPKGLMSQFKDLEARLKAIGQHTDEAGNHIADINNIKFNQLKDEFHSLDAQLEASGQKGKNFVDRITSAVKNNAVQFLARYASFYDLLRYGQQIYSTINNLDYALVDLKKTTTMSTSELNSFYTASNDIAKQNGVTTKTIIDQAAAWSRLGKSSKHEVETMSALSSQFKAISPGMTEENATDGLISSMQAFHIAVDDVERDIMDNVNRIGNTMATSNDEIVEMLKRSSAAMHAANNDIKETIALESAAVQITRNAETTGTAFRTNEIVLMYSDVHISLHLIAGKT